MNNAAYLHEEVAKWVKHPSSPCWQTDILPVILVRQTSLVLTRKTTPIPWRWRLLVWVVVDLFLPFIEKRLRIQTIREFIFPYYLCAKWSYSPTRGGAWQQGEVPIRCQGHGYTFGLLRQISYCAIVCMWCSQPVRACLGWAFRSCCPWGCKFLVPGNSSLS